MSEVDGLKTWVDGPVLEASKQAASPPEQPRVSDSDLKERHLWVVRVEDVAFAMELCAFGRSLPKRMIKHTNLTGGGSAFGGGEVLFRNGNTIIVNGSSGRYGPRSADEMQALAVAFRKSGYNVWSMGYDRDANRPLPFIGVAPQWVS